MTLGQETLHFQGMHEAYPILRDHIKAHGRPVAPRGEPTLEVLGATFSVADAVHRGVPVGCGRKVGIKMQAIDGTGNLAGASYPDVAIRLAKVMDRFADDLPDMGWRPTLGSPLDDPVGDVMEIRHRQPSLGTGNRFFQGAYGPRIGDQLQRVETQLRRDPDTRQAVVNLWSETDRDPSWKDRPCTTQFQLMIRDGALDMFVTMRANDLWTGTCYDVFQFGQVQAAMANVLRLPVGTYHHHATSLHIYERDLEKFEAVQPWIDQWDDDDDSMCGLFPAVDNPRESWGPDWSSLQPGAYSSWGQVRDVYGSLLKSASEGEDFDPLNDVEAWYWDVVNQVNQ